jgi:hypothetical protein
VGKEGDAAEPQRFVHLLVTELLGDDVGHVWREAVADLRGSRELKLARVDALAKVPRWGPLVTERADDHAAAVWLQGLGATAGDAAAILVALWVFRV